MGNNSSLMQHLAEHLRSLRIHKWNWTICMLRCYSFILDENFSVPHNKRGIIGMANKGRHTNASQFYITLQPTPWMDTKYVAFG